MRLSAYHSCLLALAACHLSLVTCHSNSRRSRARSRLRITGILTSGFVDIVNLNLTDSPLPNTSTKDQHQGPAPAPGPASARLREWGHHTYPHSRNGPFFGAADFHDGDQRPTTSRAIGNCACALPDTRTTSTSTGADTGTGTVARPFRPFSSRTRGRLRCGLPSAPSEWLRAQLKGRRRSALAPSPPAQ